MHNSANVLRGDIPVSHWESVDGAYLLDVREPMELVLESVPGAVPGLAATDPFLLRRLFRSGG